MTIFFYVLQWLLTFARAFGVELLFLGSLLVFTVLIAGVLAPLGALSWWAGWSSEQSRKQLRDDGVTTGQPAEPAGELSAQPAQAASDPPAPRTAAAEAEHYLVYLSGIGDISGDYLNQRELNFVTTLQAAMPRTRIIHDIFAFSVTNVGLTEEEFLGRFWHWMKEAKLSQGRAAVLGGVMINGRNLLQVTVSADRRYGPVFNYGTARTIYQNLLAAGFRPGSGVPVTLFGYSGGGQVVLGSAQYLKAALDTPLQVISLGGVMADMEGLEAADEVVHLQGTQDTVQRLGDYLFPRRWPVARGSRWNQTLASGKLRRIVTGPMLHAGPKGYLDPETFLDDGRSYLDSTVALVVELTSTFRAKHVHHRGTEDSAIR